MPGTLAGGIIATALFIIAAASDLFTMHRLSPKLSPEIEEETE